LVLAVTACEKTPEDVRKWEKDKRAPQKMKEFILGETSTEVKVEAATILIEKGLSSNLIAIFKELSGEQRALVVEQLITRIDEMIKSEKFGLAVRGKDAAYYLANANPSDEQKERLHGQLVTWVDGDNFWCPLEKVGDVDQLKLFQEVGVKGLPAIEKALNSTFDEMYKSENAATFEKRSEGLLATLNMIEDLNLPETEELVAKIFVERAEKAWPKLDEIYAYPFLGNKSLSLLPLAERILLDPDYKNDKLNAIRDVLINTYYRTTQRQSGVQACTKVVREDRSGSLRWMCAQTLLELTKEAAIEHVFMAIPDDPVALQLPADHPNASAFPTKPEANFWFEAGSFCRAVGPMLAYKVPVEKFRSYLTGTRTVERLLAMECLSYHGTEADLESINALATETTDLSAWNAEQKTMGEYATALAAVWAERHADIAATRNALAGQTQ
jgi:hypothetical protein